MHIRTILTDNGKEFTDRLFGLRKRAATGKHEFDLLCSDLGIEHRLAPRRFLDVVQQLLAAGALGEDRRGLRLLHEGVGLGGGLAEAEAGERAVGRGPGDAGGRRAPEAAGLLGQEPATSG